MNTKDRDSITKKKMKKRKHTKSNIDKWVQMIRITKFWMLVYIEIRTLSAGQTP